MANDNVPPLSVWAKRGDQTADWRDGYTTRTTFDLAAAAYVRAGIQPDSESGSSAEGIERIDGWVKALQQDLDKLLISNGINESNHFLHLLSHEKLRARCRDKDITWPIPENYVERIKSPEQELEAERELRLKAQQIADPVMSPFVHQDYCLTEPPVFRFGEPDEVYRHFDYLTADEALDWMKRISKDLHGVHWAAGSQCPESPSRHGW